MAFRLSAPFLRNTVAALGVASVAVLGLTAPVSASTDTTSASTFDTTDDWDGSSFLYPFGNPQTSNYGQIITVPAGKKKLTKYSFYLADNTGTGTLTFRGEVYGWDGTLATDKVFQSKKQTLDLTAGDPEYKTVTIKTKGAKVKAGEQYVLFLTVDKDYEDNPPNVLAQWGTIYSDVQPGGGLVYLNSDGDESQWTTVPWSQISDWDFAFKASLK